MGALRRLPDLMRDLSQRHSVMIDLDGKRYRLQTSMVGSSYQAFQAAGVRPPETVITLLGPTPPGTPLTQLSLL